MQPRTRIAAAGLTAALVVLGVLTALGLAGPPDRTELRGPIVVTDTGNSTGPATAPVPVAPTTAPTTSPAPSRAEPTVIVPAPLPAGDDDDDDDDGGDDDDDDG